MKNVAVKKGIKIIDGKVIVSKKRKATRKYKKISAFVDKFYKVKGDEMSRLAYE